MLDQLPLLTLEDPVASAEGALDPLGLYGIADLLGLALAPGLRERMKHPRFLTSMAVSFAVTQEFDDECFASDHVSAPWQVFEWIAVEGFVRSVADPDMLRGLPGRLKGEDAVKNQIPLCADRYLKTPTVFGFHGVYRYLATNLMIQNDGRLDENGYCLLKIWEIEQNLPGFVSGQDGAGAKLRKELADAVRYSLEKGAVSLPQGSKLWNFFGKHLLHSQLAEFPAEREFLCNQLVKSDSGHRSQIVDFLRTAEGAQLWLQNNDEALVHDALVPHADSDLQRLLSAIKLYESFSRLLTDAFYEVLYQLSLPNQPYKQPLSALCNGTFMTRAAKAVPSLYEQVAEAVAAYDNGRLNEQFSEFSAPASSLQLAERIIRHHERIQQQKPPNGKQPWFDRTDRDELIIRPGYRQENPPEEGKKYVHQFRTNTVWSFLRDFGLVRDEHEQESEE